MPTRTGVFEIDDTKSFDANLAAFIESLEADDPVLAGALKTELLRLLRGECDISGLWDALAQAAAAESSP